MPDISGLEFMESLTGKPLVIFTTAYSAHAVKSYELEAVDYLLKPFSLPRFLKACSKARELHDLRNVAVQQPESTSAHIFLKSGAEKIRVQLNDILYIEAAGNYMTLVLLEPRILYRLTTTETQELIPSNLRSEKRGVRKK